MQCAAPADHGQSLGPVQPLLLSCLERDETPGMVGVLAQASTSHAGNGRGLCMHRQIQRRVESVPVFVSASPGLSARSACFVRVYE
jgi:hypothetical protein